MVKILSKIRGSVILIVLSTKLEGMLLRLLEVSTKLLKLRYTQWYFFLKGHLSPSVICIAMSCRVHAIIVEEGSAARYVRSLQCVLPFVMPPPP